MTVLGHGSSCTALVLHFTKPSNSEANVLGTLLQHLDPGIDVHVVLNQEGDNDPSSHLHKLIANPAVTVTSLDLGLPVDPWRPDSRLLRLIARSLHPLRRRAVIRLARDLDVDLVYTSQQRFDCRVGERIARRLGVPHVVHLHYTPGPWLRRHTLQRILTCDRVIAISQYIRREVAAAGTELGRIEVIPNTIVTPEGPAERKSADGSPVVVGQVGRMSPGKGFPESVEVFARLHTAHPGTSLLLVGDGPERSDVERTIQQLGVQDVTRSVGWQGDIKSWLDQIDVFVHPSRSEPFGLSVLEAMAAGIPVVAYGDAGVSELVDDGMTGYLVEPGDLDAMTAALSKLVEDRELRHRLGDAGRERARLLYDPASAGAAFSRLLREVATRRDRV